jgi:UDP-2,3-diacylglucosamine hydrolase
LPQYYFISDAHLGMGRDRESDRERERKLLVLLHQILDEAKRGEVAGLFIVGDLFDSWFEFKSVVPRRHVRTLAAIAHIGEHTKVDYLMGNHDFGHRDFFRDELGIAVHGGDITTVLHGKRFFIAHGDGKAANDGAYLILRRILRNRVALFLYGLIHPDIGIPFAERVSGGSRVYTDGRQALQKQDGMKQFAEEMLATNTVDYVVMGHRHKPELAQFPSGIYVNLGDWIHHFTYGLFDGHRFRIMTNEGKELLPGIHSDTGHGNGQGSAAQQSVPVTQSQL